VQQARRLAHQTAFVNGSRLVEVGETKDIFTKPAEQLTYDYVTGNIG
jgi:phosphate transport system ATP-binding protein